MKRREKSKKEQLKLTVEIFEKRYAELKSISSLYCVQLNISLHCVCCLQVPVAGLRRRHDQGGDVEAAHAAVQLHPVRTTSTSARVTGRSEHSDKSTRRCCNDSYCISRHSSLTFADARLFCDVTGGADVREAHEAEVPEAARARAAPPPCARDGLRAHASPHRRTRVARCRRNDARSGVRAPPTAILIFLLARRRPQRRLLDRRAAVARSAGAHEVQGWAAQSILMWLRVLLQQVSSSDHEAEPTDTDPDGPYAFRRKEGCSYHAVRSRFHSFTHLFLTFFTYNWFLLLAADHDRRWQLAVVRAGRRRKWRCALPVLAWCGVATAPEVCRLRAAASRSWWPVSEVQSFASWCLFGRASYVAIPLSSVLLDRAHCDWDDVIVGADLTSTSPFNDDVTSEFVSHISKENMWVFENCKPSFLAVVE